MFRWVSIVLVLCFAACHHDKAVQTTPPPAVAAAPPAPAPEPVRRDDTPVPVSTHLGAEPDLVHQCQLRAATAQQAAPKFDFDRAELTPEDRSVLDRIADCVTRGPLRGKRLQLTGRADPRGTEEYNMGLGDRRARTVSTYLERLGVAPAALSSSTRGALDATGHDEASWQIDRRVDLAVAN